MSLTRSLVLIVLIALAPTAAQAVEVVRVVSPGGIEAWLVEDHATPVVSLKFSFKGAGASADPSGREGLANLAASTMDEGAGDLDSQAFQGRLADRSIELKFRAGLDNFSGEVRTLSARTDEAFGLLALALTAPRFDTEPVERIKSQILAGIRRDSEDPGTLAFDALMAGLFPDHGYGRRTDGTVETVSALGAQDLKAFAATRLGKSALVVGVAGDIAPEHLGALLDATFGGLPEKPKVAPPGAATPKPTGRVTVIDKDIVQSAIAFGHGGLKRDDPDFYAALVMNHILGGGSFTSRLYQEVREKRGLAYSVGTGLYALDGAGLLVGNAGTENARVGETLAILHEEWRRVMLGDVTQAEVDDAKTYLTGAFPLTFTSSGKIANVLVSMQLDGLGADYLDKRRDLIGGVTLADVKRVAARYLDPERLDIVVVGRPGGF